MCGARTLPTGSSLRNTEWVIGIAIYTGHDSKVMMNASAAPSKRSTIERGMDTIVLSMLGLLFAMGTATAVWCGLWIKSTSPKMWYLDTNTADMVYDPTDTTTVGIVAFLTSYVLYGYLIPISLYVSLEFVKVVQAMVFLNGDRRMYHAETDTPMRARTSNLNEELGMVHTVLSDKTGTLTCNSMEFFKCSVAGVSYGEGVTEIERSIAARAGKPIPSLGSTKAIEPGFNFRDARLEGDGWMRLADAETIRDFFRVLAVCHTVIPEGEPTPERICYQAESPDEMAFVVAAKRFGYFFKHRTTSGIDVVEPTFEVGGVRGEATFQESHYEVLHVLEFNSTRKRMSVIVKTPEGKIMLYTKGADSIIYERLKHGAQKFMDTTQEQIDGYAMSGLRTLCLATRELSTFEYEEWSEIYVAASQSLEKRDEKIDAAAELIEKELFLVGATAIEDKLQEGVPHCIEQMMRAGIAVWVLTGDKQDTAINIAQACALIQPDMEMFVINIEDLVKLESDRIITREEFNARARAAVKEKLDAGSKKCDECQKRDVDMSLVIEGRALSFALEKDLAKSFLSLGSGCTSVVCCRVSPLQKALVTGLVKDSGRITLAIGDGANDVGMIQAAHIGVGISGQEGMQAVMASDFAFAQFRFLERLLLVHGRYNYKRVARMVTYFFYKNLAFGLTLFMYNLETSASGQVVYNDWLMSAFNIFMVSLPVLALGCLDQDVNQQSCLKYPHLYKQGQLNVCFAKRVQVGWAINAAYVAVVVFFVVFKGIHGGEADHGDGHVFGLWEVGTSMYTAIVVIINLQMAQMINYWTWIHHIAIWGSIAVWYCCNILLSNVDRYLSTYSYKIFVPTIAPTPKYWIATPLLVIIGLLPDLLYRGYVRLFAPEDHMAVQEMERHGRSARRRNALGDDRGVVSYVDADVEAGGAGVPGGPGRKMSADSGSQLSGVGADAVEDVGDLGEGGVATPRTSTDPNSPRGIYPGSPGSYPGSPGSYMRSSTMQRIPVSELPGTLTHYQALQAEMSSRGVNPVLTHTSSSDRRLSSSAVVKNLEKSQGRLPSTSTSKLGS